MSKYIDADKVIDYANQEVSSPFFSIEREGAEDVATYKNKWAFVKQVMVGMPTADVVEVVRCKDCKHRYVGGYTTQYYICDFMDAELKDEGYCSYGERKDG